MTFPLNLPPAWFQVWMYTYTKKDGHKNRMLIRQCLHQGMLEMFRPSDVAGDQLRYKYDTFFGHPSTGSIPTLEQFKSLLYYMPNQSFIDMDIIDPAVARLNSSLNLMNLR